jgi:NAD(P)H-flavin reductase
LSLSLEAERDRVEREWGCRVVSCREVSKDELEFTVRFQRRRLP